MPVRVAVAGWSIPRAAAELFPDAGGHLRRYAGRLTAVEINSSFYRPHRPATYARWAAETPDDFRFAVKAPRTLTHDRRLRDPDDLLDRFVDEIGHLGPKLGPVLVQLPPSLAFEAATAEAFFATLRRRIGGPVACEPRHASWFTPAVDARLGAHRIARVAADPARAPDAGRPGGWGGLVYVRLHGAPKVYYSDYDAAARARLAADLAGYVADAETWCVFDNTAAGCAQPNALDVRARLARA